MPPGNSNNKAAVRNKCTFCGKSTCVGNECNVTRYPPRNYEPVRPPSFISITPSPSLNARTEFDTVRAQNQCTFCGKQTCVGSSCRNVKTAGSFNKIVRPPVRASQTGSVKQDASTTTTPINDAGSSSGVRISDGGRNASSDVTTVSYTNSKTNSPVDKSSSSSVSVTPIPRTSIVKQNAVPMTASSTEGINALAEVPLKLKPNVTLKSVVFDPSPSSVSAALTVKISKDEQNVLPETLSSAGKSHAAVEAVESSSIRVVNNVEGRNSLPDVSKSLVSSAITLQTNSEAVNLQTKLNKVPENIKGSSVLQGEGQNIGKDLTTGKFDEKSASVHSRSIEEVNKGTAHHAIQYSNISVDKKIQGSRSSSKMVNKNGSNCSEDGSESLSSFNDQKPRKHSKGAVMYEGRVIKYLGPRIAMLQVTSPGAKNKKVQLFVDRLLLPKSESFYPVNTDIKSVLCIGDALKLVCTTHNKKNAGFDFFAHEAWKVENFNSNKFDNESVASFVSHDSLPVSDIQARDSSRSRYRRIKDNDVPQSEPHNLSDAIYQWLDQNNCIQTNNNFHKKVTLKDGCDYIGNVTEIRLPFTFIVGISVDDGLEYVFGIARNFYPEGPNSQSVGNGVKIDCYLNVGSAVVITVTRTEAQGKFEWMVKKAWPFGKGNKTLQFFGGKMKCMEASAVSGSKCVQVAQIEPQNTTNASSVTARIVSDVYGEIVTLQNSWGLVKEIGGLSTYIFLRKNAFLFGVCLQNYVLDDVLDEGQFVWFNKDNEEDKIYVNKLWYGDKLSNFYSFEKVMRSYCEEMQISFNNEDSLVSLGKGVYLKK